MNFLETVSEEESVKQHIHNLLFLRKWEKPFHPEIWIGIQDFLFEVDHPQLEILLSDMIKLRLEQFEPRIDVIGDVQVESQPHLNSLKISFQFKMKQTGMISEFSDVISRKR